MFSASVDDSSTTLSGPGGLALDIKDFTFDPPYNDISTAHTPADIEKTVDAAAKVLRTL